MTQQYLNGQQQQNACYLIFGNACYLIFGNCTHMLRMKARFGWVFILCGHVSEGLFVCSAAFCKPCPTKGQVDVSIHPPF